MSLKPNKAAYFTPARMSVMRRTRVPVGIALGPVFLECPDLFTHVYHQRSCSKCNRTKWADEFDWKVKGSYGPFKDLWGKHDSYCKECRSTAKAERYRKKKVIAKADRSLTRKTAVLPIRDFKISNVFTRTRRKEEQDPYRTIIDQLISGMTHENEENQNLHLVRTS